MATGFGTPTKGLESQSTASERVAEKIISHEVVSAEFVAPRSVPVVVPKGFNCWGHLLPIGNARELGRRIASEYGWNAQWAALDELYGSKESGWETHACNPSSGACGVGQALPCSKSGWKTAEGQIRWAYAYIRGRYTDPNGALYFWRYVAPTKDINRDGRPDGKHWY